MRYKLLGKSGLRVAELALGTMTFGEDWGWVDVGHVGQFNNGIWYVRVRDIWRATHGARQRDRADVPDWRR